MAKHESERAAVREECQRELEAGNLESLRNRAEQAAYKEAARKCIAMLQRLEGTGFTSFF